MNETNTYSPIEQENSYHRIFQRIFSFGSIQVVNILVNLIRGKFVALFLGPEGMGISSLFVSSTTTIQQISGLGLNLAFVKEIAKEKDNPDTIPHILSVAKRLIWITALLGFIICAIASPWLSRFTFGNESYTISFVVLSAGVLLSVAGTGYMAILQGLGEVKRLAKASLVGGIIGLILGVPLYWIFQYNGIVPAMILLALAVFLFYYLSYRKISAPHKVNFDSAQHTPIIRRLISLGVILMLGTVIGTSTNYLINVFVRNYGSVDDVGLFQAANSLTNQYIGFLFTAMAMDYFPRLSAVIRQTEALIAVVNRQAEIVMLIATPIILILILSTPLIIKLLLTDAFISITPLMRWLGMGVLLQCVTFPISYLFLAGDNRRLYIWCEIIISNILWIVCSIGCYYLFDLVGLGISLVVRTLIDIFITFVVCSKFYKFRYTRKSILISSICIAFALTAFIITFFDGLIFLVSEILITLISIIFSLYTLKKLMGRNNPHICETK